MTTLGVSRRELLAGLAATLAASAARTADAAAQPDVSTDDGTAGRITTNTIREAEKLLGMEFTAEERTQLATTVGQQVQSVQALRRVQRPTDLEPALVFDPRLPGVHYPPQEKRLRTAAGDPGALPASDEDIAYAPVTAQSHWIRTRQITSAALTDLYLQRIERIAPKLKCYITVTADLARRQARAMDEELAAGRYRGPLHGIPYGLKDVFDTAGIATTWGAEPYRDRVPETDARVTVMLSEAGAVLLGKTATGALANGWEWFGGICRNPWNIEEPAGGSSTGSGSATAAALCSFAIGTDSLGSILNPADRCGLTGLRATFGRVPVAGAMPLTPSLDRVGPLCRSVEDAAVVLAAINGHDPCSPTSIAMGFEYDPEIDPGTIRVGYAPAWFEQVGFGPGASVPASAAHRRALKTLCGLGVSLVEIELPALPYGVLLNNLGVESAAVFEALTLSGQDESLPKTSFGWANTWRQARLLSAVDYLQVERFRRQLMRQMHEIFQEVDLLFGPTYGSFELIAITNFTGHPGMSMRAGIGRSPTRSLVLPHDPHGLEHTITHNVAFHGRLFEEGRMLAVARELEAALGVSHHRPPVG